MNTHRHARYLLLLSCCLLSCSPQLALAGDARDFETMSRTAFVALANGANNAYGNKNYNLAFARFQRMACAGDKPSQAKLGTMYLSGEGIARDDLQGYLWLKVASEFEFPAYRNIVKKIESVLTPEQLKATAAGAEALRNRYGLRASNISCNQSSSSSFGSNLKDAVVCSPQAEGMDFQVRRCEEEEEKLAAEPVAK